MGSEDFDARRAKLQGPDTFQRFRVEGPGVPVGDASLDAEQTLIVARRGEAAVAFLKPQLAYHHVAQGELAMEPYVVDF